MVMTPEDLAAELTQAGYPLARRGVIDWIQKGLLPHPRQRGLGRGRGSTYYWPRSEARAQAFCVACLLRWYGRIHGSYLPLGLLGYDVPLDRNRHRLKEVLASLQTALIGKATTADGLADRLSRLAVMAAAQHRPGRSDPLYADMLELGLNILTN